MSKSPDFSSVEYEAVTHATFAVLVLCKGCSSVHAFVWMPC